MTRTRPLALIALAAVAAGLAGCGVDTGDDPAAADAANESTERTAARREALPQRPSGTLAVALQAPGSLTANAINSYRRGSGTVRIVTRSTGPDAAFREFCAGRVDLVDAVRPISRGELAACKRNGIDVPAPYHVASDAIVLATRNGSDVGGDCLRLATVRDIFKRGSTIRNWSEVGFDVLPLTTTGPDARANAFGAFAALALDVPSGASLSSLRADYLARRDDAAILATILNTRGVARVGLAARTADLSDRRRLASRFQRYQREELVIAERRIREHVKAVNERNRRRKVDVDADRVEEENKEFSAREKAAAVRRARRRAEADLRALSVPRRARLLATARRPGTVGFVRFTFYENYEDELRPFEIDSGLATGKVRVDEVPGRGTAVPEQTARPAPDANRQPNCIFPSQETITSGEFPLARKLRVYGSRQTLARDETKSFLEFYLTNAPALAVRNRLVPIPERLQKEQLAVLTGTEASSAQDAGTTTGPTPSSKPAVPGVASPEQ